MDDTTHVNLRTQSLDTTSFIITIVTTTINKDQRGGANIEGFDGTITPFSKE